jgi:porphobilinogen synthase
MSPTDTHTALTLTRRMRRLRQSETMRSLVRETRLSPEMFVLPLFVCEGEGVRREVASMPGVFNLSVDEAVKEAAGAKGDGVRSVLLFGLPDHKDDVGSNAYNPEAPVQSAVRAIKHALPDVLVITDVCLCEYTDHGHCGLIIENEIANDPTVEQLVRAAVSHAAAGADVVAPSDMMDGRIGAIRQALDRDGLERTVLMSYAVKFQSTLYGPFRVAADAAPKGGTVLKDRATYQLDPARPGDAWLCAQRDDAEGADILMVKPGLPYLDLLRELSREFRKPWAVYHVSGEFAALEALAASGLATRAALHREIMTAFRRAGASMIITYGARFAHEWLSA